MKPSLKLVPHGVSDVHEADGCPSCRAPVQGAYCVRCGEAINAHSPTAGEFIHEFVGHYVALEGKLWQTLRLLLLRPGQLTAEYLRGRRVPTINPLRLYLTLSLIMFALIKLFGIDLPRLTFDNHAFGMSYAHTIPDPAGSGMSVVATIDIRWTEKGDEFQLAREVIGRLESVNPAWAKNVERFSSAPPEEKADILNHGFVANLPYMLIGALPLFALYLKLMYWRSGRHYGEHLVFAMHVTAFAFLLAIVMIVLPGNFGWLVATICEGKFSLISPWDCLQLLPVLCVLAYLPAAMRRVYGGSRPASWGRSVVLMTVHLLVIASLIVGAEGIAILRHG